MANIFDLQLKTPKNRKQYLRASVNHDGMVELQDTARRIYQENRDTVTVEFEKSRWQQPGSRDLSQDARWFVIKGALMQTDDGIEQFIQTLGLVETETASEAGNL